MRCQLWSRILTKFSTITIAIVSYYTSNQDKDSVCLNNSKQCYKRQSSGCSRHFAVIRPTIKNWFVMASLKHLRNGLWELIWMEHYKTLLFCLLYWHIANIIFFLKAAAWRGKGMRVTAGLFFFSSTSTQKVNFLTNHKGYGNFETTVRKLLTRRIQIFWGHFLCDHYLTSFSK